MKRLKGTEANGYYQIKRNDLSKKNKKKSKAFKIGSKSTRTRLNKKRPYLEDLVPSRKSPNKNKSKKGLKVATKSMHYNQVLISDDSSDISFTEVKLAQLYTRSRNMQKELVRAFKNKDYDRKFQDALKNVLKLDVVKE